MPKTPEGGVSRTTYENLVERIGLVVLPLPGSAILAAAQADFAARCKDDAEMEKGAFVAAIFEIIDHAHMSINAEKAA